MQKLIKYVICPKCGKQVKVDTSIVLTSYPAKYGYHCQCGHDGYCLHDEIYYRYIDVY